MRLSNHGLFALFVNVTLIILMLFSTSSSNWMYSMSVIIVCSFALNLILLKINGLKLLSLSATFIVMSYLFYFGQLVLNSFFPEYQHSILIGNFATNKESVKDAVLFSYIVIQCVEIWIVLLGVCADSCKKNRSCYGVNTSMNNITTIAWIFIFLFSPVNLYLNFRAIAISRTSTYTKALASLTDGGGFLLLFSIFLVIGMVLMLYAYPKKKKVIYLIEIFYLLLMTLSGSRIYSIISIIVITLCYVRDSKGYNYKKIVFISVIGYFLLNIVSAISRMRLIETIDLSNIVVQSFSNNNNVILQILEEFGGTIYSVILPYEQVPNMVSYGYGATYLKGFFSIFPNIGGFASDYLKEANYLSFLNDTSTMGGSYIGELYYNFGVLGFLFSPLIAYMLVKIDRRVGYCIECCDYYHLAFYIMPMYCCLIWVRGYFSFFFRSVIWASFIIFIIKEFVLNRHFSVQNQIIEKRKAL